LGEKRAAFIAVGALLAAGIGAAAFLVIRETPPRTTAGPGAIGVSFSLLDLGELSGTVGNCSGTGGYSDFEPGVDVTVRDKQGSIVGSGGMKSLEQLQVQEPEFFEQFGGPKAGDLGEDAVITCRLGALIQIEGESDFYEIDVGRRGETSVTRSELEENDWIISLSLGP
jgi:hypothetical protein